MMDINNRGSAKEEETVEALL